MPKTTRDSLDDVYLDVEDLEILDDLEDEGNEENRESSIPPPKKRKKKRSSRASSSASIPEKETNLVLKWTGIIGGLLTLVGLLVGYGIWIGGTNTTITTLKSDVKDLKDADTKTAKNLQELLEKLNKRLQNFEVLFVQHQSSIDALRSEIRIRHGEDAYLERILTNSNMSDKSLSALPPYKRRIAIKELQENAQKRASVASDITFNSASKTLPLVVQDDSLSHFDF